MTTPDQIPQPAEQPAAPQRPKKRPVGLIIAACAGALVVVIAVVTAIVFATRGPDPKDPMTYLPKCRDGVRAQMKAPATTRFPGGETIDASEAQPTIVGVYDSENSFSALVRGSYRCLLAHNDDGTLRVVDVTVEEK